MAPEHRVALVLADAMLAVAPGVEQFVDRLVFTLGRKPRWLTPLCRRVFSKFGSSLSTTQRDRLIAFIREDSGYRKAWLAQRKPRILHYVLDPPRMGTRTGALAACAVPSLATTADLAAWLGLSVTELDWFADTRRMVRDAEGPLCHYRYRWIPKRAGAFRLMEAPKWRLRALQRKILREILDKIPAHRAAHGFRLGHSCLTYANPHVCKAVVLRMDLRNFFPSIPAGRVNAFFKTLGYPEAVARTLTGLCTNHVPPAVLRSVPSEGLRYVLPWAERQQLAYPHLPQGAPTSPALANLCALHLDLRLDALAESLGGDYTRYADDLAFSGGEALRRRVGRFGSLVAAVAREEGFRINHRKTRAMHRSDRQVLTGIVVNERTNVPRPEYDNLKAILTNCLRFGAPSQNRDGHTDFRAHLIGRVGYVKTLNATRGEKLEALLSRVDFGDNRENSGGAPPC